MGLVQPVIALLVFGNRDWNGPFQFRIPSRNELMSPQLYITVLAYTPFLKNRGRQVCD